MNLFIPINSVAKELIFWERYEDIFFFLVRKSFFLDIWITIKLKLT